MHMDITKNNPIKNFLLALIPLSLQSFFELRVSLFFVYNNLSQSNDLRWRHFEQLRGIDFVFFTFLSDAIRKDGLLFDLTKKISNFLFININS
jgi:hypothetical protein